MAIAVTFGDLNVGDVVKISENGVPVNYIIVHKGLPSDMYDVSCDGVWLLREQVHSARAWDGTLSNCVNDYENSDIVSWLNGDYLKSIDGKIRDAIKTVKIPYKKGAGNASTGVQNGENGYSCKVFLLSSYEVGLTKSNAYYIPIDGHRLDYFLDGTGADAITKRISYDINGAAVPWWLRSARNASSDAAVFIGATGGAGNGYVYSAKIYSRPAFVLPKTTLLNDATTVNRPYFDINSFDYNGLVQTPVFADNLRNFDSSMMTKSGTLSGTSADEYEIYISLKDGCQWEDGTTDDITLAWRINPITVDKPVVTPLEYDYDGSGAYNSSYYKIPAITGYDENIMSQSGAGLTQQYKAGTYPVVFALKDPASSSWSDGTTDDYTVTWEIKTTTTPIPVVTSEDFTYDGKNHSATVEGYKPEIMTQSGNYGNAVNAGNYSITYALRDPDSCTWEDGTVDPKTVYWNINKQTVVLEKPYLADDQREFVYDGTTHTPVISNRDNSKMSVSGTMSSVASGDWEITVSLKTAANIEYRWADNTAVNITLPWKVKKGVFAIPSLSFDKTDYNGTSQTNAVMGYNSAVMLQAGTLSAVKADTYSVTYSLKDKDSAVWSDNTTEDKTLTWRINAITVEIPTMPDPSVEVDVGYSGSSAYVYQQSIPIKGFNASVMSVAGNSGTYPGEYTAVISLKDPSSCGWTDGTIENKRLNWEITKKVLQYEKPSLSVPDQTYDGTSKNPGLKGFVSKFYGSSVMRCSGAQTAISADEYLITVEFYSDRVYDYKWTDGTAAPIELKWTINKASFDVPVFTPAAFKYDGTTKTPVENGFNANVMARSSDSVLSAVEAGTKTVNYSLKDTSSASWSDGSDEIKTVEWRITVGDPVNIPDVENVKFVYDGVEKTPAISGFDTAVMTQGGIAAATNAGKYPIVFSLKDPDSICWADGTVEDKKFEWQIEKKVVSLEKPRLVTTEFNYNGKEKYPGITGFNDTGMVYGGETFAVEAGTYFAIVSLKDAQNYRYQWADGATDDLKLEWIINPITVSIPTLLETMCYYGGAGYSSWSNKWWYAYRHPQITSFDENIIVQTGASEGYRDTDGIFQETKGQWYCASQWRVGKYYVKFSIKHLGSCAWEDGTVGDVIYEWSIVRRIVLIPKPYLENTVFIYDGTEKTPVVTNGSIAGVILSGDKSATAAGEYVITASVYRYSKDEDTVDYRWEDNTVENIVLDWSIIFETFEIPAISPESFVYDGKPHLPAISGLDTNSVTVKGDVKQTSAGEYEIVFVLKDPNSSTWSDGSVENKVKKWTITKGIITKPTISPGYMEYDGEAHTIDFSGVENDHSFVVGGFDPDTMVNSGDLKKIDVGNYNVVIGLKDPKSCTWSDGSICDTLLPWEIRKKTILLDKPYLERDTFLYDGKVHTPIMLRYNTPGMVINGNSETSAVAAGNYRITLDLQEDKNITYLWGDAEHNSHGGQLALDWAIEKAEGENAVKIPQASNLEFIYDKSTHKPDITGATADVVDVGGVQSAVSAGNYEIIFSLRDKNSAEWEDGTTRDIVVKWAVKRQGVDNKPSLEPTSFEYDGKTHSPTIKDYYPDKMMISGAQTGINADKYTVVIKLNDNYQWADGTLTDVELEWGITKRAVDIPTVTPLSFVYDNSTKSPDITGLDQNFAAKNGEFSGKDAGDYEIVFSLNNKTSCEWSDGTNDDIRVTWKIAKRVIDKPGILNGQFLYDGNAHSPEVSGSSSEYVDVGGDVNVVAAGDYEIVFSLNNKASCEWSDGTTDDVTLSWKISPQKFDKPHITGTEFVYDEQEHSPVIIGCNYKICGVDGVLCAVDAGNYTITFSLKDKNSAAWADGSTDDIVCEWRIKKAVVRKPYIQNNEFTYNSGTHTPTVKGFDPETMLDNDARNVKSAVDAGQYHIYIALISTNNYEWEDGGIDTADLSWVVHGRPVDKPTLDKTSFQYDGKQHAPRIIGFKSISMTKGGNLHAVIVGDYKIIIGLQKNYEWRDGGFDTLELPWQITKIFVAVPRISEIVFQYDGVVHAPDIGKYDTNIISVRGTLSAVNSGKYKIIFSIKDKEHCEWKNRSSDDIEIEWEILKRILAKPDGETLEFVYNGGYHSPVLSGVDGNYMAVTHFDEEGREVSGVGEKVDAGVYSFKIALNDKINCAYDDGTTADITFKWSILRKTVKTPYLEPCSFEYDGDSKAPAVKNFNREIMEIVTSRGGVKISDTSAANVGKYRIVVLLGVKKYNKYGYEYYLRNYQWEDGTVNDVVLEWEIVPGYLDYPTVIDKSLVYNWQTQTPRFNGFLPAQMIYVGTWRAADVGVYQVGFKLKDGSNFRWRNPADEGKMLTWEITKLAIKRPPYKDKDLIYNGYKQTPVWLDYDIRQTVIGGVNEAVEVGEYTVTFTPTNNFMWADGSVEPLHLKWSILRLAIGIPVQANILYYNGEEQKPAWQTVQAADVVFSGETTGISADEYYVSCECNENCYFAATGTRRCDTWWKINKCRLKAPYSSSPYGYTGEVIAPEFFGYDTDIMTANGDMDGREIGEYTAKFDIRDKNNYEWHLDVYKDSKGIAYVKWRIISSQRRAPIPHQSNYLVYNGEERSPVFANYIPELMTLLGGIPSKINAGVYYVTFTLKSNVVWLDGTYEDKAVPWRINPQTLLCPYVRASEASGGMYYYELEGKRYPVWANYDPEFMRAIGDFYDTDNSWHTTTFILKDPLNYEWGCVDDSDYTVRWKLAEPYAPDIKPAEGAVKVHIPRQISPEYENGETKYPKWDRYDSTAIINLGGIWEGVNADTYYVILMLGDGYIWEDGTTEIKAVPWKILSPNEYGRGELEYIRIHIPEQINIPHYDGLVKEPEWDEWDKFGIDIVLGELYGVLAGVYYLTLKPQTGYMWEDGTTEEKIVTWVIEPGDTEIIEDDPVPKDPMPEKEGGENVPDDDKKANGGCCCCDCGLFDKLNEQPFDDGSDCDCSGDVKI